MRVRAALPLLLLAPAALAATGAPDVPRAPAAQAATTPRVLVFTRTTGFRHGSIGPGVAALRRQGRAGGFAVDHTEDPARFTTRGLARYRAVVFLSTTGRPLATAAQRSALRRFVERGGGFLGVHAAADTHAEWPFYVRLLGTTFRAHPATQRATVRIADPDTAATRGLPRAWSRTDEWYAFDRNPRRRGVHVLATLDETTYDPQGTAMGADHPIAWCHRVGRGRSVYTALGHTEASYGEARFLRHLRGAVRMAARLAPFGRCA